MTGIVLVTHLRLSLHLIEAAERIVGKQPNLISVSLEADESLHALAEKISQAIQSCLKNFPEGSEGVLILTDLFGSTPTNASLSLIQNNLKTVQILTGVNLPMLISALSNRNKMNLNELAEKVLADGKKGIQNAKELLLARLESK